jgi:hypothetical protein
VVRLMRNKTHTPRRTTRRPPTRKFAKRGKIKSPGNAGLAEDVPLRPRVSEEAHERPMGQAAAALARPRDHEEPGRRVVIGIPSMGYCGSGGLASGDGRCAGAGRPRHPGAQLLFPAVCRRSFPVGIEQGAPPA